jgi:hypothetical protein
LFLYLFSLASTISFQIPDIPISEEEDDLALPISLNPTSDFFKCMKKKENGNGNGNENGNDNENESENENENKNEKRQPNTKKKAKTKQNKTKN